MNCPDPPLHLLSLGPHLLHCFPKDALVLLLCNLPLLVKRFDGKFHFFHSPFLHVKLLHVLHRKENFITLCCLVLGMVSESFFLEMLKQRKFSFHNFNNPSNDLKEISFTVNYCLGTNISLPLLYVTFILYLKECVLSEYNMHFLILVSFPSNSSEVNTHPTKGIRF